MSRIYYKSDFSCIVRLFDKRSKQEIGFPDHDFSMALFTSGVTRYIIEKRGDRLINCVNDSGHVRAVCKNHRLAPGIVKAEILSFLPNDIYPDGIECAAELKSTDIELTSDECTSEDDVAVDVMLPYIKGDAFTYEDFTPEQIEELKRPAAEAAAEAGRAAVKANDEAQKANMAAGRAEGAADSLMEIENAVVTAEGKRERAEDERIQAEAARVEAEHKRSEEFAEFADGISGKADRTELSNVIAQEPLTSGNFPDIGSYTREELKMDLFVDMFNSAASFGYNNVPCGRYDPDNAPDPQHPFRLNESWLTYEEAMLTREYWSPEKRVDISCRYQDANKLRTTFFMPLQSIEPCRCKHAFRNCINMETAAFIVLTNDITGMFFNCRKFRKLIGHISLITSNAVLAEAFHGCYELEEILIYYVQGNISFSDSPKLSLKSLNHLVVNRQGTNSFTVTVHPEVYAKLTDGTNTEWHALMALAAEKNINFATV